jgi:hypothetical protein
MKFVISLLLIILLAAIGELFAPWWAVAVSAFLVALILKPKGAFLCGFLAIGSFWLVAALLKDMPNDHILSTRLAALFHLPSYSLFIAVTSLIGALTGGLSAWAGAAWSRSFRR